MTAPPATLHRIAITIDIDDPDGDVIHTWAALHAGQMLDELWKAGVDANLVGIKINRRCDHDHACSPTVAEP